MRPLRRWTGAVALATAALGLGYLLWTLSTLECEVTRRTLEVSTLRNQIGQQQDFLKIVRSPQTRVVALGGLEPGAVARGRVWWHGEAGGFFLASGLPAAPAGKTYQLWAMAAGTPLPAGVFDVDPKGSATLRVKPLPGVEKVEIFAVTLEPAGGLPKPSGPMYLTGRL